MVENIHRDRPVQGQPGLATDERTLGAEAAAEPYG